MKDDLFAKPIRGLFAERGQKGALANDRPHASSDDHANRWALGTQDHMHCETFLLSGGQTSCIVLKFSCWGRPHALF